MPGWREVAPVSSSSSGESDPPIAPTLDLANDEVLGPRPEARPATAAIDPAYRAIGERMTPDLVATQTVTLGRIPAARLPWQRHRRPRRGRGVAGPCSRKSPTRCRATFARLLRQRISKHQPPPHDLWSAVAPWCGSSIAMPVTVRGEVAGVVYASRTPRSVLKHLYEQRNKAVLATLSLILPTLLLGFVLHRTITAPMRELIARTDAIATATATRCARCGVMAPANSPRLSQSFFAMARSSTGVPNSSPPSPPCLARIEIAADLDPGRGGAVARRHRRRPAAMTDFNRRKFLDNNHRRHRPLAKVAGRPARFRPRRKIRCRSAPRACAPARRSQSAMSGALEIAADGELDTQLRMSDENIRIILSNLADNAARHGRHPARHFRAA